MNYSELYGLPVQLRVRKEALKKKYIELSRQHHPDYFTQQGEAAQKTALEQSAIINKAYKTLSEPDETIKYVLALKGQLTENEKYSLPSGFLMEMMALHETVADAQFDEVEKRTALNLVLQREAELYEPVRELIEKYDESTTTETDLLLVKDYYFKKKYLERLKQQLGEKL